MRVRWWAAPFVVIDLALAVLTAGLVVVTVTAIRGVPPVRPSGIPRRRFAVLVPAHDEELLIGRLLQSVRRMDYPGDRVDVHVVADNCRDRTAAIARSHGAFVHERLDPTRPGKGFALGWFFGQLGPVLGSYDAIVVLDADSVVDSNFLRVMDAHLEAGSQVIQAHGTVLNVDHSPVAALRYAALAAANYVRPLGKAALGLSCGLKGNGMCFAASVLRHVAWDGEALAEDVDLHLALVRRGIKVDFAPETTVRSDMPVTFGQAVSQNARWERGRIQLVQRRVVPLLLYGITRGNVVAVAAALEQLVPPLSVPFALGGLCLAASVPARSKLIGTLAAASLAGHAMYVLTAMAIVGAPRHAYRALAYAPAYIGWKLWIYATVLASPRRDRWIRTARLEPFMPAVERRPGP